MALRMLEVLVRAARGGEAWDLLQDATTIERWRLATHDDLSVIAVVLDATRLHLEEPREDAPTAAVPMLDSKSWAAECAGLVLGSDDSSVSYPGKPIMAFAAEPESPIARVSRAES